jgi:hypothetical protein
VSWQPVPSWQLMTSREVVWFRLLSLVVSKQT